MRSARQVLGGIITALVSVALLIGVFSISLAEGKVKQPASTLPPTVTITLTSSPSPTTQVDSPTPLTPTLTPTRTSTLPPTPSNCPPPLGWVPYTTLPGDTLDGIALKFKKTSAEISQANCLGATGLQPGMLIYLPPVPTATPSRIAVACRVPSTWVIYIVQPGDTLFHLGQAFGIPYTQIQTAICMSSPNLIAGQRLYVPPWGTHTPSPTFPYSTDTPFATWTDTPTVPASDTSTPVDTDTPMPPTDTPMPTDTVPTP